MKSIKGILINVAAYALVTILLIASLNLYVFMAQKSKGEELWQVYSIEYEDFLDKEYPNRFVRFIKKNEAEEKFRAEFEKKHGRLPGEDSPLDVAQKKKRRYLQLFFFMITPIWLVVSLAVFYIRRKFLRAITIQIIIIAIASIWIIISVYLPALVGRDLKLLNTLVLIIIPAGIAWALIYVIGQRFKT